MTAKRFTVNYRENTRLYEVKDNLHILDCGGFAIGYNAEKCCEELNALYEENKQLKKELQIYHKLASCSNCNFHDYDEFDNNDGSYDEFEVCRKGNDVTERICNEWREL